MTRMASNTPGQDQAPTQAHSNIYTVMVIISTAFVAIAAVYVAYRNVTMFDTIFP